MNKQEQCRVAYYYPPSFSHSILIALDGEKGPGGCLFIIVNIFNDSI